jgi:outer membrane protein TolC
MKNNTVFLVTFCLFMCVSMISFANQDSLKTLHFKDYMTIVVKEHPLAKKAYLQQNKGAALVTQERGDFDPYLFNSTKEKYLNENQYYSNIKSGIKIPTWFGVEFQLANEYNRGFYLNPENNSGTDGLWFAGVSVPIGQGLLIDQRRADLRKAQLFEKMSIQEQNLLLNELLYNAGKSYWDWYLAYHVLQIYSSSIEVAQERLNNIKNEALIGEKPLIDTVEATIQIQNLTINWQQAQMDEMNARALLSVFLWYDGTVPFELENNIIPSQSITTQEIWLPQISNATFDVVNHPEIIRTRLKIDQYTIDYRLTRDKLKPKVDLNYNFLNDSYLGNFENYSVNNYTWGVNFSMPLFLRETRGELKFKGITLSEMQLDLDYKKSLINYKVIAAQNQRNLLIKQLQLQEKNVENYRFIFESERKMFELGESSLFILNNRELNYITSQIKRIEMLSKGLKTELEIQFSLGSLFKSYLK